MKKYKILLVIVKYAEKKLNRNADIKMTQGSAIGINESYSSINYDPQKNHTEINYEAMAKNLHDYYY